MTHLQPNALSAAPAVSLPSTATRPAAYVLRFDSLFVEGRALAFPCDAQGHVDEAALSPQARLNFHRAQAVVGREYRTPAVCALDLH